MRGSGSSITYGVGTGTTWILALDTGHYRSSQGVLQGQIAVDPGLSRGALVELIKGQSVTGLGWSLS